MKELYSIKNGRAFVNLGDRTIDLHSFLESATTHIVGKPKTVHNLDRRCINRAVKKFIFDNIKEMPISSGGLLTNAAIQLMEDIQHGR